MSESDAVFEDLFEDAATDPVRELLEDGATAYLYLMESWLTDAVAKLRDARREADLTQKDVAERLGTKQPAIARLERDHEGRFTLRRFVEYALACDALPLDVLLKPADEVRRYALQDSETARSEKAFEVWHSKAFAPGNAAPPTSFIFSTNSEDFAAMLEELRDKPRSAPTTAATEQLEERAKRKPESDLHTVQGNAEVAA